MAIALQLILTTLLAISRLSGNNAVGLPCDFDERCTCSVDGNFQRVNCSFRGIRSIPKFPPSVYFLNLRGNHIKIVENGVFNDLKYLTELDLSRNNLIRLERNAFLGLQSLSKLNLASNTLNYSVTAFPKGIFKPLKALKYLNIGNSYPSNIDFSRSRIFPEDVIIDAKSLESLDIDVYVTDYSLPESIFGPSYLSLTSLRILKISKCNFSARKFSVVSLPYLESIDISNCRGMQFKGCTFCNRTFSYLNLANTHLDMETIELLMNDFLTSTIKRMIMTNIMKPQIKFNLWHLLFAVRNTGVYELYLNENNINKAGYLPFGRRTPLPQTLRHLNFANNKLKSIQYKMENLSFLDLSYNRLGGFLKTERYMLSANTSLRTVNLSFNNIAEMLFETFHGHTELEVINISNNALNDISFDISHLNRLKIIDLASNKIRTFAKNTITFFDSLFKQSKIKINLSNNPILCNCGRVNFLTWIMTNRDHFINHNEYICSFDNGTVVSHRFQQLVLELEKECSSYAVLIICVSMGILLFGIILVAVLVYRYRWRLRYIYYMTRRKYKIYKQVTNKTEFQYHAFVSYSVEDQDFVVNECIPKLEREENLQLCIHQRDFIPGEEITHNITNGIHKSNKTICIISRSFLDSYYCMFEFNMARMESIYSRDGTNILFLVFYEQIQPRELPLVMLEVVQEQSYIEYPNEEQGNVVFWKKLKEAIH